MLHKLLRGSMGIRPVPFILILAAMEGRSPYLAKAIATRMGGDNSFGSVSLRVKRGALLAAHLPRIKLVCFVGCLRL